MLTEVIKDFCIEVLNKYKIEYALDAEFTTKTPCFWLDTGGYTICILDGYDMIHFSPECQFDRFYAKMSLADPNLLTKIEDYIKTFTSKING